jgi:hypothetical protein
MGDFVGVWTVLVFWIICLGVVVAKHVELDEGTLEMTRRLLDNNWFRQVGVVDLERRDVVWVPDWKSVSEHYAGYRFENYLIDSVNAMTGAIRSVDVNVFNQELIPAGEAVNSNLLGKLRGPVLQAIPVHIRRREKIAEWVESLCIWACNESYWATRYQVRPRACLKYYEWFLAGHIPCGGAERYPSMRFFVY